MFKYTVSLLVVFTLFITACGNQVDYIGDTYAETSEVDLYFSSDDVSEDYRQMGRATVKGNNSKKLQEQLVEKAKKSGADGIIIEGFREVYTGEETTVDEGGELTTNREITLQVTAIFIKYHKNL